MFGITTDIIQHTKLLSFTNHLLNRNNEYRIDIYINF